MVASASLLSVTWPGLGSLLLWIAVCGGAGGVVVGALAGDHFAAQLRAKKERWQGAVAGVSVAGGAYVVGLGLLAVGAVVRESVVGDGMSFGESAASLAGGLALGFVGGLPYLLVSVAVGAATGHMSGLWLGRRARAS